MKGRLNRESNPVPGEKPGFLPQHESTVSGEFVVTGENNPFPTKIKNIVDVQFNGKVVEEKILLERAELRTVGQQTINLPDLSCYKSFDFFITNSLKDETGKAIALRVGFLVNGESVTLVSESGEIAGYSVSPPTGNVYHTVPNGRHIPLSQTSQTISGYYNFTKLPRKGLQMQIRADQSPTDGAVTIILEGQRI